MSTPNNMKITFHPQHPKLQQFFDSKLLGWSGDGQHVVLAGGACRAFINDDESINDFDLFIIGYPDEIEPQDGGLKARLIRHMDNVTDYKCIFKCPEGLLFSYKTPFGKVQLITPQIYPSIADLIGTFDVSPCCFAYDGREFFFDHDALADVVHKRLTLRALTYPLATMHRLFKYKGYGYDIREATTEFIKRLREDDFKEEALYQRYID